MKKIFAFFLICLAFESINGDFFSRLGKDIKKTVKSVEKDISKINISAKLPTTEELKRTAEKLIREANKGIDDAVKSIDDLKIIINKAVNKETEKTLRSLRRSLDSRRGSPKYQKCSKIYNPQIVTHTNNTARLVLNCGMDEIDSIQNGLSTTKELLLVLDNSIQTGKVSTQDIRDIISHGKTIAEAVRRVAFIRTNVTVCIVKAGRTTLIESSRLAGKIGICFV